MKKHLSISLVMLVTLGLTIFAGCAPAPSNNNTNIAVATPEPTPDKAAIETELTRIENDWPRIIHERDGATVRKIEADDVVIVYPDGSIGNKEQDAKDIEAGLFTFDSWDTLEVKVNVVDKNFALVTLRYTVKNAKVKSNDGRSMDISGQYVSLDTFARRNGQWQFIGLSSVKVQAPVAAPSPAPGASSTPAARPSATPRSSPATRPTPVAKPSLTAPPPAARPSVPRPTPPRTTATPVKTP